MIDNLNLTELLSNEKSNMPKTRVKKINPKLKEYDEEAKRDIKMSRLNILEEDEDFQKEDKDDSDYDMDDEDTSEKKKRTRKTVTKTTNKTRFGKINVSKYFSFEKGKPDENIFPNYNNIAIKPSLITKSGISIAYKICNVCFGFANYTCPRCGDRYCSKECNKTHKEIKCVKYIEL